jgi:hypothetical protein
MRLTSTLAIVSLAIAAGACARGTQVTSGGDVASVTPATRNYLPVGTTMSVRLNQSLSTSSREGDSFSATVVDPVYAQNGGVAVPAGAMLDGHITGIHNSTLPTEQNVIRLNFDDLRMNGRTYPFSGAISNFSVQNGMGTSSTTVRDATTGAVAGAVLGAVVGGAELSKIITGGLLGAAAGTVISMGSGGGTAPATIPAGSVVTVKATQSVQVR